MPGIAVQKVVPNIQFCQSTRAKLSIYCWCARCTMLPVLADHQAHFHCFYVVGTVWMLHVAVSCGADCASDWRAQGPDCCLQGNDLSFVVQQQEVCHWLSACLHLTHPQLLHRVHSHVLEARQGAFWCAWCENLNTQVQAVLATARYAIQL